MKNIIVTEEEKNKILSLHKLVVEVAPPAVPDKPKGAKLFIMTTGFEPIYKMIDNILFRTGDETSESVLKKELREKFGDEMTKELEKLALKKGEGLKEFIEATIKKIEKLGAKEKLLDESEKALKSILDKMEKGYGEKMTKEEVEKFTKESVERASDEVVNKTTTSGAKVVDKLVDDVVDNVIARSNEDPPVYFTETQIEQFLRKGLEAIYGNKIPQEVLDNAMAKIKNSPKYKDSMDSLKELIEVNAEKSANEINQEIETHGLPLSDDVAKLPFLAKVQYWLKVWSTSNNILTILFQYVRPDEWLRVTRDYYASLKTLRKNTIEQGRGNPIRTEKDFHNKLKRIRELINGMNKVAIDGNLTEKQRKRKFEIYQAEIESEVRLLQEYKKPESNHIDIRVNEIYNNFYKALQKQANEDPDDIEGCVTVFDWWIEAGSDTKRRLTKLEELIEQVVKSKKDKANTGFWEDSLGFLLNWRKALGKDGTDGFVDDSDNIKKMYKWLNELGKYELPKPKFSIRPDKFIIYVLGNLGSFIAKGIQKLLSNTGNLALNIARTGVFTSPQFINQMFYKYGYPKGMLLLIIRWVVLFNFIIPVLTSLRDAVYILAQFIVSKLPDEASGISGQTFGYILKVIIQTILYCFAIGVGDTIGQYLGYPESQKELAKFQDELTYTKENFGKELGEKIINGLIMIIPKVLGTLANPTPLGDFLVKSFFGVKILGSWLFTGKISGEDVENLKEEWGYLSNPTPDFVVSQIFDFRKFIDDAFKNKDMFKLNNLEQELERIKKQVQTKANAQVEILLDESTKTLLNNKLEQAKEEIKKYLIEPRTNPSFLSQAEFIALTDFGFLTYNPNYIKSFSEDDEKNREAQSNIQRFCRDNGFSNLDPNEAPIGILVGKVFYPYVDDYSIISSNRNKIISYKENTYEPHFYDKQNDKFISLRKMANVYLKTDVAKVQLMAENQLKTNNIIDDINTVTKELFTQDEKIKELIGPNKDGKGGSMSMWVFELISASKNGTGKVAKPYMNNQFELAYNNIREVKNEVKKVIQKSNERIDLINQYIEKFVTWANAKSNTNSSTDKVLVKAYIADLVEKDLEYDMVEKEVQNGEYTVDNAGKKTYVLHKVYVPVLKHFEYNIYESKNKKQNIINERYLLGNKNMRTRYLFEESDEKRFGENKFDHWYDTFTFQKYDEKSGEFKDIDTDSLKHGKIKERFNDFIKNYDGDDAFVRSVVDTHPEVSRFKYLKDQANIQEAYYPTGLASILSVIRESKGEYEIFSVSRQKGGNWNLVKGDFTQKEMSNMVLTKQIPPEKKPRERENGLESLKKKEATGTNSLRNDEKEGLKNLPKKVKEKVQEKISRGWTTELPPNIFKDFYEESEISSVFNEKIPIYKLEATPEFFRSLQKNSSHVLIRRGFCRLLLMAKNDSDINSEQRKVVNHIISKCEDKFEGKLGLRYLYKKN